jgi:hypothetical protein
MLWLMVIMQILMSGSKMDYRNYITSTQWRSKHKDFLKASHHRCAFFPWVKVGEKTATTSTI